MNLATELEALIQEVEAAEGDDVAFAAYGAAIVVALRKMLASGALDNDRRRQISFALFRTVTDDRELEMSPLGRRLLSVHDRYMRGEQ